MMKRWYITWHDDTKQPFGVSGKFYRHNGLYSGNNEEEVKVLVLSEHPNASDLGYYQIKEEVYAVVRFKFV